ncbi:GyrI-like domain-containing protein, partial [Methanoculleus sp.]|uniref:GyrI-like domain-containing protein n=1 Tax=Methanoculleus sp. TaxID=90427 RepID=UPI001BD2F56B
MQLNEEQGRRQKVFEGEEESSDRKTELRLLTGKERRRQGAERYRIPNRRSKMPRVSNIDILRKREQPTLSIRIKTKVENLPMLIGESYGKMAAYLKELGEYLSDVPYVAYHNRDMQNLAVEIGFPVSKALPGKGDIQAGSIPEEVVPKCRYREGDTRSKLFECLKLPPVAPPRTLPRVAIPNGKPFHHFCLEYGSD